MAEGLITEPGVYDLTAEQYHADPVAGGSLSSTGARRILSGTPAAFRYEQTNPPPFKADFNFGHAAHSMILGKGAEIVTLEFDSYRTKAAQTAKAEALAAGQVPLLPDEFEAAEGMAKAIWHHPVANSLFNGPGLAEEAYVWQERRNGVMCRALLDWVRPSTPTSRAVLVDYKTTKSAALPAIAKSVYEHGYHQQEQWYRAAYEALHADHEDPYFLFVFQEKTAPYLVQVVELDVVAKRIGAQLNRDALDLYAWCAERDTWPGYSDEIQLVALPAWAENRHLQENSP